MSKFVFKIFNNVYYAFSPIFHHNCYYSLQINFSYRKVKNDFIWIHINSIEFNRGNLNTVLFAIFLLYFIIVKYYLFFAVWRYTVIRFFYHLQILFLFIYSHCWISLFSQLQLGIFFNYFQKLHFSNLRSFPRQFIIFFLI